MTVYRPPLWVPSPTVRIYRQIRAHDVFEATFDLWRWYLDGTESGATAHSTEGQANTNSPNVFDGDVILGFRVRNQETGVGSGSGAGTDDYGLEFDIDGGGFNAVTASSTGVQCATGSQLTDGGTTTQRLTAGGGSFQAGQQDESNGLVDNFALTADGHTEHVFALLLVSASLSHNNAITFRMTLNGASTNIVQPGTLPILTIVKTAPAESLAFARKDMKIVPLI